MQLSKGLREWDWYRLHRVLPKFTLDGLEPPVVHTVTVFGDGALKAVVNVKRGHLGGPGPVRLMSFEEEDIRTLCVHRDKP